VGTANLLIGPSPQFIMPPPVRKCISALSRTKYVTWRPQMFFRIRFILRSCIFLLVIIPLLHPLALFAVDESLPLNNLIDVSLDSENNLIDISLDSEVRCTTFEPSAVDRMLAIDLIAGGVTHTMRSNSLWYATGVGDPSYSAQMSMRFVLLG